MSNALEALSREVGPRHMPSGPLLATYRASCKATAAEVSPVVEGEKDVFEGNEEDESLTGFPLPIALGSSALVGAASGARGGGRTRHSARRRKDGGQTPALHRRDPLPIDPLGGGPAMSAKRSAAAGRVLTSAARASSSRTTSARARSLIFFVVGREEGVFKML